MKVPLGFWRPEPGETPEEFDQRVFAEMTAAIALVRGDGEKAADPGAEPKTADEPGGEA